MKKIITFLSLVFLVPLSAGAMNIDSINNFAWGENIGWVDFALNQGNVEVSDTEITGYAHGSNVGWISLNCSNTDSCDQVEYGVTNDTEGQLSGYAWGENIGWVDFGGVSIHENGDFFGYAYSPNIGYISFNCVNTDTCEDIDFKVATSWTKTASTTVEEPVVENPEESNQSSRGRSGSRRVVQRTAPVGELSLSETILTGPQDDQPTTSLNDGNKISSMTQDLYFGMTHENVKKLQQLLNKLGYTVAESGPGSPGNETNYFGALTRAALSKFQADNGVTPSVGYFGPKTRALFALKGF